MFWWIVEAAAAGLMGRAVFWHVPKLAKMIWNGWHEDLVRKVEREVFCQKCGCHKMYCPGHPLQAAPTIDMDLWEAKAFIDCPSAFWLEPSRYERATWPATPVPSDLRYDGSVNDKILAFAMLTGPERLSLSEQKDLTSLWHQTAAVVPGVAPSHGTRIKRKLTRNISSKRTFDRRF